jgi:hypothetical protein
MVEKRQLKLRNSPEFVTFLDSLSKINESAILEVVEGEPCQMTSLISSSDNTLILYAEFLGQSANYSGGHNIPDIKKLTRVIESITEKDLKFIVNSNNIEYKDKSVKFKYHLYEDGFLSKPSINLEKIKQFNCEVSFSLTKNQVQQIIKGSTFATDTTKIYFYTEDGQLKAELTDRARHNTDVYTLSLGEVDFDLKPLPVNFDNIKFLNIINNAFTVSINTQYGVMIIDIETTSTKLKYIITSLTQ